MRETAVAVHRSIEGHDGLILLTLDLRRNGKSWLGTRIELGTAAYADSLEELREELLDAISLQLNEVERLGGY